MNGEISSPSVRLIDEAGSMVGLFSVSEALRVAKRKGLDLVEIYHNASPPVCKIMDCGKYQYEVKKKARDAKKNQKIITVKEVKLRPNIASGDYETKLKNVKRFVGNGDKVKVSLMFRGREITHKELGFEMIQRFANDVGLFAKIDKPPKMEGRQIFMIVAPV